MCASIFLALPATAAFDWNRLVARRKHFRGERNLLDHVHRYMTVEMAPGPSDEAHPRHEA